MLRTVVSSARCLTSNVPKASYLRSSCRLLHSATDVSRPSHDFEALPQITPKNANSSRLKGLPKERLDAILEKKEKRKERRRLSLQSISNRDGQKHGIREFLGKLQERSSESLSSRKKIKREKPKLKVKFKNSLAAQTAIRPAVQSARLKEISEKSGTEEAIDFVMTAPHDSLNHIVWNTLIFELMKAGRRKRAYEIYIEMKRRGFSPGSRTFSTMLLGMDSIPAHEWPSHSELLERCHKLYDALESYSEICKEKNMTEEFSYLSAARGAYVRVLGKTGNFQKIVDIFYRTNDTGPLARDKYLYSSLFSGLLARKEVEQVGTLSVAEQNASDAKFYWRTLEKDLEHGMEIDSYVLTPFIKIMASGRPADQQFGWNVVRDFFGLAPPGEDAPLPRLPLSNHLFHAILELCNKSKKFRLCAYFLKQVIDQKRLKLKAVADVTIGYRHVNEQLIALGQLAAVGSFDESEKAVDAVRYLKRAVALVPAGSSIEDVSLHAETVTLALGVCWQCRDWERASEVFSLATDVPPETFLDDGPIALGANKPSQPPSRKSKLVYTSGFAHMARTALVTEDKSKIRQCLRMMSSYGADAHPMEPHLNFYKIELAKATLRLVEAVSAGSSKEEAKLWKDMKRDAHQVLSVRVPIERPEREDDGLGSEKYIGKLQQAIDFELSAR